MNESPLREAAVTMHELYEELRAVGFKRRDALGLVANIVGLGLVAGMEDAAKDREKNS